MFGYMMEALVDLGELELARRASHKPEPIQRADGSIPAYPGATWICSTGMAQLAIAWLKFGDPEPALRAISYLEQLAASERRLFRQLRKRRHLFTQRKSAGG